MTTVKLSDKHMIVLSTIAVRNLLFRRPNGINSKIQNGSLAEGLVPASLCVHDKGDNQA
jgi:hypothetical protein